MKFSLLWRFLWTNHNGSVSYLRGGIAGFNTILNRLEIMWELHWFLSMPVKNFLRRPYGEEMNCLLWFDFVLPRGFFKFNGEPFIFITAGQIPRWEFAEFFPRFILFFKWSRKIYWNCDHLLIPSCVFALNIARDLNVARDQHEAHLWDLAQNIKCNTCPKFEIRD